MTLMEGITLKDFQVGQVVEMKKSHPCGTNRWKILRIGADFRIQCLNCKRSIMIPRVKFQKKVKKVAPGEEFNRDNS